MKIQLLSLSLLASSPLIGQGEGDWDNSYQEDCCSPQLIECVDGVAYTAAFYDLQCDWGFMLDVEFLYWYAGEGNLSYGLIANGGDFSIGPSLVYALNKSLFMKTKWSPGFRVGLGCNSDCDGWDVSLDYTWVRNTRRDKTSLPIVTNGFSDPFLINPWVDGAFQQIIIDGGNTVIPREFNAILASWRLESNLFDLQLGRKYWLSSCFNLRPYGGLRGGFWKTRFETDSTAALATVSLPGNIDIPASGNYQFIDMFHNSSWGVGLLGGLQSAWYFCCNFALYGNFSFALLWGETEVKKGENYTQSNISVSTFLSNAFSFSNTSSQCFSLLTPILDLGLGVRWEETWCSDRYRTSLDLGWEHHIYFDQNHRMKTFDSTASNYAFLQYATASGNLGLGGFVLKARFDF